MHIGYKTDRPAKIAVFAVDQGILQVTDYKLPDPLGYFFRKCALAVETAQIVDLILPEFSILRAATAALAATATAESSSTRSSASPKSRSSSGRESSMPTRREREVIYDVPDYFAGTLTIMAVAVAADSTGAARKGIHSFADRLSSRRACRRWPRRAIEFEVGVTVANNVDGSGENAEVHVTAEPSAQLEIVKAPAHAAAYRGRTRKRPSPSPCT